MQEKARQTLLDIYRQDAKDYRELAIIIFEFSEFLKAVDSALDDDQVFEGKLNGFIAKRAAIIKRLSTRKTNITEIEKQARTEMRKRSIREDGDKDYLDQKEYQEFVQIRDTIDRDIAQILEMDNQVIESLKAELKAIKQKIYQLGDAKKIKNSYENYGQKYTAQPQEARFIDKSK